MKRIMIAAAFCVATMLPALAVTLEGTLSVYPNAVVVGQTINFEPPGQRLLPAFGTGDLAIFNSTSTFTMQNQGTVLDWTQIGSGSDLACGSNCIATGTDGTSVWSYNFDHLLSNFNSPPDLFSLVGFGYISLTGFDPTPAHFWLAWDNAVMTNVSPPPTWAQFSIEVVHPAVVPAPIIGAGLPALAALGLFVFARLRRRLK